MNTRSKVCCKSFITLITNIPGQSTVHLSTYYKGAVCVCVCACVCVPVFDSSIQEVRANPLDNNVNN